MPASKSSSQDDVLSQQQQVLAVHDSKQPPIMDADDPQDYSFEVGDVWADVGLPYEEKRPQEGQSVSGPTNESIPLDDVVNLLSPVERSTTPESVSSVNHLLTDSEQKNAFSWKSNIFFDEKLFETVKERYPNRRFHQVTLPEDAIRRAHRQSMSYNIETSSDPLELEPLQFATNQADLLLQSTFLWVPIADSIHERYPGVRGYSHLPQVRHRNGFNECVICPLATELTRVPPPSVTTPLHTTGYVKTKEHCLTSYHLQAMYYFSGAILSMQTVPGHAFVPDNVASCAAVNLSIAAEKLLNVVPSVTWGNWWPSRYKRRNRTTGHSPVAIPSVTGCILTRMLADSKPKALSTVKATHSPVGTVSAAKRSSRPKKRTRLNTSPLKISDDAIQKDISTP